MEIQPNKNGFLSNLTLEKISGSKTKPHSKGHKRKVYDNIHGFIYFDQSVWDFIDTPHFQRLRRIKQLGNLQYVFPGATHTRFEHCIGTAHLAKSFIELLIDNHPEKYKPQERQSAILTVTLAGLLHDIGHGPYSHTFDGNIVTQVTHNNQTKKWTHEIASEILFEHMTNLEHLKGRLTPQQILRIKALIRGDADETRKWQFELISNKINGIDVDKLDYFRRDAFYLGAKNIYIDHELLMNEARIVEDEICYPTKYVEIVYNIFHSRYKLYKNYYFNVISTGIQQMVCDILELSKEKLEIKRACEQIFTNPDRFIRLNDSILQKIEDVYENILSSSNPNDAKYKQSFQQAVKLIHRIKTRKIYKFVKELTYYVKDKEHQKIVEIFEKHFKKAKIIAKIIELTGLSSNDFCVTICDVGFGLKEANPLKKVGFFRKEEEWAYERRKVKENQIESLSMLYTNAYIERSIKFFIKNDNPELFLKVDQAIQKFKQAYQQILKLDSGKGGKTPAKAPKENQSSNEKAADIDFSGKK